MEDMKNALLEPLDDEGACAVAVPVGESLPWPNDVTLYQPLEDVQLLVPELASCLAVKTYLRMCGLPFLERQSDNAEFMTTGGRLTKMPMLRIGNDIFSEFEPITTHVESTQVNNSLSSWMPVEQRQNMRSELTYVENTLTLVELHQCFKDDPIYAAYTNQRVGAVHPWPLSTFRRQEKYEEAMRLLRVYQWQDMNRLGIQIQLQKCFQMLVDKLDYNLRTSVMVSDFFYGQLPCELDALVFGHLAAIKNTPLVSTMMPDTLCAHPLLNTHCNNINRLYHNRQVLYDEE